MKKRYSLLYVREPGWPVPKTTFVELTLKELRKQLSIDKAKEVKFIKNRYLTDVMDDRFKIALRVVDNVEINGDVDVVVNIPNYGTIQIPSNNCSVVKPYLAEENPVVLTSETDIDETDYIAKELSDENTKSVFKIVKPLKEEWYDLFDEVLAMEYSVLYDSAEEDVKETPFDLVSIFDLKENGRYRFSSIELANYTDRIASIMVELFKTYSYVDDATIEAVLNDLKDTLHVVDLTDIFSILKRQK